MPQLLSSIVRRVKEMLHRFSPSKYYYTFGPHEPVLHLHPGDRLVTKTVDTRGYDSQKTLITDEQKQQSDDTEYYPANPLVGPFYIENAEPGDSLKVTIENISLNRTWAWSRFRPHFGALTEEGPGRNLLLTPPIIPRFFDWTLDLQKHTAQLTLHNSQMASIQVPTHPFIGSIGVAPRYGRVEISLTPGAFGGNMDCVETTQGTTLYFPVFVRGGYLAFGDVHAIQGDGELCGTAVETTAEITLHVDVIRGHTINWPRFENHEYIIVAGSSKPLMEAYKIAHYELIHWLVSTYGFEFGEALQIVTQIGTCRIGNVVDPNYTVVAKFPKQYLSNLGA
jgi:amidase